MSHDIRITLSDDEYNALTREAAESGVTVDTLARRALTGSRKPAPPSAHPVTSREFTERQYQEGMILALPTRTRLTPQEEEARERRARLLAGGQTASDMLIEDRGPR